MASPETIAALSSRFAEAKASEFRGQTRLVPIVHKAGDISPERLGTSHWWKNTGNEAAVLISVDIFQVEDKPNEKTM